MVDCVGGYYGVAFKGLRGVTQGEPLYSIIFNVMLDAVVRHWISLVEGVAGGKDGWGSEVLHRAAFFYLYDGLVAPTELLWWQGAFDTITGLFDRVGLRKNFEKTVGKL